MRCTLFCLFGFVLMTGVVNGDDELSLTIQPNSKVITKEVDSSLALTCRPKVPQTSLIGQLEWRDPKGRVIKYTGTDAPMYIQTLQIDVGLQLIFPKLSKNLVGNYTCTASYASSTPLSSSVEVRTIVDITWEDAPEFQYPIIGSEYRVRCFVRADPSPIVDWMRGKDPILTNDRYVVTSDGLIIKNIKESDDGIYTCRAAVLETGSYDARNIKVEVQIPPKIEPIPSATVVEGESASVMCKAHSKPPSNYTWIKIDSREDLSKKDRFVVHQNTGMLIINRAEFNDNSAYKCTAENPAGRDEYTVNITVRVKPRIYELINVTAPVENETKIICKANGRPAPQVLFKKLSRTSEFQIGRQPFDNRIELENIVDEVKGETYGVLTIRNLRREDDGLYECIADNSVDKAFKNGHIAVEFKPMFDPTKNIETVWTWRDKPGNLTCVAESFPNATIKWRFGMNDIDGTIPYMRIDSRGPISTLMITPGQPRLYAQYICIATNRLGQNSTVFTLKEAKVPESIPQVTIAAVTATTIKFNIVGPAHLTGMPLRSFICRYRREEESVERNKTWSVNAPYIIENLEPQRRYLFRFAAVNDVGIGGFGAQKDYAMPMRSVPVEPKILISPQEFGEMPPHDFVTVSPYADHYELRWNVPYDNGDPIDYYIIRYCVSEKINGEWRDSQSECSSEIQQPFQFQSYELNNLLPDRTYKIELWAHNAIGASTPAQIRVKTARGLDVVIPRHDPAAMSSSVIVGIAIAAIIVILVVVDGLCFCINKTGILAYFCECARSKRVDEEDSKISRAEREPLSPENQPLSSPTEKKSIMAQFDGKQVQMKPVEIGKYSAV